MKNKNVIDTYVQHICSVLAVIANQCNIYYAIYWLGTH